MPRNVTSLAGRNAKLICIVRNLANYTVRIVFGKVVIVGGRLFAGG